MAHPPDAIFTRDDLARHHLAYDEGYPRRLFSRLWRLLPPSHGTTVAHARRLLATGMSVNAEAAARLLIDLADDAPPDLLEETLAMEDALLRLEVIFALRRRGRRFFDAEIEEYIVCHDRLSERLAMAERAAREADPPLRLYRSLLAAASPEALPALAESMVRAGVAPLCHELRDAVARANLRPGGTLLLSSASLGCPAALEALAAAARQAARAGEDAAGGFLDAFLDHLRRVTPDRVPAATVAVAVTPFRGGDLAAAASLSLARIAALHPAGARDALPDLSNCGVPDLELLDRLARLGPDACDPEALRSVSAACRETAVARMGSRAVVRTEDAAELLDTERADPAALARAAELVAAAHAAAPSPPVTRMCLHLLEREARDLPASAAAAVAAPPLAAGELPRAAVAALLARHGGEDPDRHMDID